MQSVEKRPKRSLDFKIMPPVVADPDAGSILTRIQHQLSNPRVIQSFRNPVHVAIILETQVIRGVHEDRTVPATDHRQRVCAVPLVDHDMLPKSDGR